MAQRPRARRPLRREGSGFGYRVAGRTDQPAPTPDRCPPPIVQSRTSGGRPRGCRATSTPRPPAPELRPVRRVPGRPVPADRVDPATIRSPHQPLFGSNPAVRRPEGASSVTLRRRGGTLLPCSATDRSGAAGLNWREEASRERDIHRSPTCMDISPTATIPSCRRAGRAAYAGLGRRDSGYSPGRCRRGCDRRDHRRAAPGHGCCLHDSSSDRDRMRGSDHTDSF